MKNIGVIIEFDQGKIKKSNFGMITLARAKNIQLFAFLINTDANAVKDELASSGITKILDISLAKDLWDNPVVRAKAIVNAIKEYNISAVFGLSTAVGKDLLPRIAALLEAPLVMDCFKVDLEQKIVRTCRYSGKAIARIKLNGEVLVLGVRPDAAEPVKTSGSAQILKFDGTGLDSKDLKIVKQVGNACMSRGINLAEADVIIAGGRGMKNGENFSILSKCAKKLDAAVGASRAAVDSGWVPYAMQVGQTGEKVSPRVYIACGISGSIQHSAGMKTSGMIIAVNTDENASIMSNSDYFAVADALKIIPELTKLL